MAVDLRVEAADSRRDDWDRFAQRCGASYQCSWGFIAPKRLTHRVYRFDILAGTDKVAQCAVAKPRFSRYGERIFLDCLQSIGADVSWSAAVQVVLRAVGPGRYRYGSLWNQEAPRDLDLREVKGAELISSERYRVQAVEFARWPDWDSYARQISMNAKRNAAKAAKSDPGIRIETSRGLPSLRTILRMVAMRRMVFQRKGVPIGFLQWTVQLLRRVVLLSRYNTVSWVVFHGRYTAFALGLRFGKLFFYTDGGSVPDNGGSAWYLLTDLLRTSRMQEPDGCFVMGYDPVKPWSVVAGWENVLRQRQQCNVTNTLTSVLVFDYEEADDRLYGDRGRRL